MERKTTCLRAILTFFLVELVQFNPKTFEFGVTSMQKLEHVLALYEGSDDELLELVMLYQERKHSLEGFVLMLLREIGMQLLQTTNNILL